MKTTEELVDEAASWNSAAWLMLGLYILLIVAGTWGDNGYFWVAAIPAVFWLGFRQRCRHLLRQVKEVKKDE